MEEFFSAAEARKLMDISNTTILKQQLSVVFKSIKEKVNNGLYSATIYTDKIPDFYKNSKALIDSLNKLGYEVVHHNDQRDGSYIYIKW